MTDVLQAVITAVDDGLTTYIHREYVTGREYRDVLLDIRLIAMKTIGEEEIFEQLRTGETPAHA